jgi:hypothetical protein
VESVVTFATHRLPEAFFREFLAETALPAPDLRDGIRVNLQSNEMQKSAEGSEASLNEQSTSLAQFGACSLSAFHYPE